MSMFDLAIGNSGLPKEVMFPFLGVPLPEIPRYRDHWLELDGDAIVLAVYTRTGGGNREEYAEQIKELCNLPAFMVETDDSYANTYMTFRFRLDYPTFIERCRAVDEALCQGRDRVDAYDRLWGAYRRAADQTPRDMSVIWRAMINSIGGDA